jgi:hypothetical protein
MMRTLFVFAVLFGFAVHEVHADQPPIGTRFHPSTGGFFEIVSFDSGDIITINAAGNHARWIGGFMGNIGSLSEEDRAQIRALHPLEPGKGVSINTSSVTNRGSNAAYNHQIRVLREELVEVRGGKFQAFVIEWRERNIGQLATRGNPAEFIRTYWYAPKPGFVVKMDYREEGFAAPAKVKPWELREISRARPVASTAQPAANAPGPATTAKKLEELQSLRDKALITPAEYETKRKELIDKL